MQDEATRNGRPQKPRRRLPARGSPSTWILPLVLLILAACSEEPGVRKQRHLQRGFQYLEAGKYNEAVIELKNALQIDPALVPALHALGRAYRQKSWHGDAIRELGRAVDLAPQL